MGRWYGPQTGNCSCCLGEPPTECFDSADCISLGQVAIEDSEMRVTLPASFVDYPVLGCMNCNEDAVGDFILGHVAGGTTWKYHEPNWCYHPILKRYFHLTICFQLCCFTNACTAYAEITWVANPVSGWSGQSCFSRAWSGISYTYGNTDVGLGGTSWELNFGGYAYHLGGGAWPCSRDTQPATISAELS